MRWVKTLVPDDFDPELHKIAVDIQGNLTECDVWKPQYRDVLDKGFLGLVDFMGDDQSIVNAARVSYGSGTKRVSEDTGLIRYLIRNKHWSPVEMVEIMWHVKAPIFVFRQWHRHRAACLAGDVKLSFDLPADVGRSSNRLYTLTVKQLYEKFQPTCSVKRPDRQRNSYFKRDRVRSMMLRSCDEDSLSPYHTQIVNIWESGVKPVLQVEFEHGGVLRATGDHRCFTNLGWLRLTDAISSKALFAAAGRDLGYTSFDLEFATEQLNTEQWSPIPFNPKYEASTLGRVRSLFNTQGNRLATPLLKQLTPTPQGYRVVSLSENGISRTYLVHRLVLAAFGNEFKEDEQTRHVDNNRANNLLSNLKVGTALDNGADRMSTGTDQRLSVVFVKPVSVQEDGEEMTYDIEVLGPYHNFLAGGVYVHNSINEYSGRYSVMSDDMYMPEIEALKPQSKTNKQGREGKLSDKNAYAAQLQLEHVYKEATQGYRYLLGNTTTPSASLNQRLDFIQNFAIDRIKWLEQSDPEWAPDKVTEEMVEAKMQEIIAANGLAFTDEEYWGPDGSGLSRELSRICLPVSTYSEMYWKSDLRNIFNFISLRSDPHAQHEIKVYSDLMLEMLKPIAPVCVAAFIEYQMKGRQFSAMEYDVVKVLYQAYTEKGSDADEMISKFMSYRGASKREIKEFIEALKRESI